MHGSFVDHIASDRHYKNLWRLGLIPGDGVNIEEHASQVQAPGERASRCRRQAKPASLPSPQRLMLVLQCPAHPGSCSSSDLQEKAGVALFWTVALIDPLCSTSPTVRVCIEARANVVSARGRGQAQARCRVSVYLLRLRGRRPRIGLS